jgi:hypothetical protein
MCKHRKIVLKTDDFFKLYFARFLGKFCSTKMFKKRDKLIKLYDQSEDKINKAMNMVKVIKAL